MRNFVAGVSVVFAGGFIGYLVRTFIPYLITGTSTAENVFTYLVPLALFFGILILAFLVIFGKRKANRGM
jgi:hypothetical protein